MTKNATLILLLQILCVGAISQVNSLESRIINNDSIRFKFSLVTPSVTTLKTEPVAKCYVYVIMPAEFKKVLAKKNLSFWLPYLEDNRSDWAANMILYFLNKRDRAPLVYIYKTREMWLNENKKE